MKQLLSVLLLLVSISIISAQPKSEVRAVWLTTNGGSDWPVGDYTQAGQKAKLTKILDKLEAANFNTIVLQVQVKGDALWSSTIQPAMKDFTGNGSKELSYNVCDYVIEECHKRNMECHAWIVPYRIGSTSEANRYSSNKYKHVSVLRPELCVSYGGAWYLDPGLPEVREYLINVYRELIANHDFDGTNFDYTRYPGADFNDATSYAKYGNGKNKDDWRRQNINTFVHDFYDMAKSIKPHIKVGAAPIGTYKNVPGYGNMTAFGSVFQDACEWMQAGKQDMLIPQMYWNEKYGFSPNMTTWVENSDNRQLVVGLAPYKMDDSNNWDYTVVTDQIEKIRAKEGMSGICFFRTEHVIGNTTKIKQLYNALETDYFKYPSHIVAMDYNGITKPNSPTNAIKEYSSGSYQILWDAPETTDVAVKYYCVYVSETANIDITDIKKCIGFAVKDTKFNYTSANSNLNFAITAFDNNYYESDPVTVKTSGVDGINGNEEFFSNANQEINMIASKEIKDISFYSATGSEVKYSTINSNNATISFTDLTCGMYIIIVRYADGTNNSYKVIR